jgi:hypothetical protein
MVKGSRCRQIPSVSLHTRPTGSAEHHVAGVDVEVDVSVERSPPWHGLLCSAVLDFLHRYRLVIYPGRPLVRQQAPFEHRLDVADR